MGKTLRFGNGGWCAFEADGEHLAYLRFSQQDDRYVIAELYMNGGVSGRKLRQVPLGQIESWVNSDPDCRVLVGRYLPMIGPDLATAAAAYSTTFGERASGWVVDMMRAQVPGSGVGSGLPRRPAPSRQVEVPAEAPTPRLVAPSSAPYPDDFYQEVAEAYSAVVAHHQNPSARLADAAGVPITTVHRWVRKARDRGFLPPAQKGKAG